MLTGKIEFASYMYLRGQLNQKSTLICLSVNSTKLFEVFKIQSKLGWNVQKARNLRGPKKWGSCKPHLRAIPCPLLSLLEEGACFPQYQAQDSNWSHSSVYIWFAPLRLLHTIFFVNRSPFTWWNEDGDVNEEKVTLHHCNCHCNIHCQLLRPGEGPKLRHRRCS